MPWYRDQYADAVRDCGYALRPNEKLVALVYADHAGDPEKPGNDVAWVSWPRLSEQTGIRSKDALNRAVRHLEKRGWLVLAEGRRQHKSPRYRIAIPANPEVRETYVWEESEVRETDHCSVDNQAPEVRGTDVSAVSEVRLADICDNPEVRETTPEVRETTLRGTRDVPDPSTDPSTTDNPPALSAQPQDARPVCKHPHWTADGDCVKCGHHDPCPDCRRLARINPTMHCYRHQEAS